MKKTLAYITTAVLLGVIVMLAPLQLLPSMGYPATGETMSAGAAERRPLFETLNGGRAAVLRINLLNGGLMLAFSFVFALGVFLYVRKRIV